MPESASRGDVWSRGVWSGGFAPRGGCLLPGAGVWSWGGGLSAPWGVWSGVGGLLPGWCLIWGVCLSAFWDTTSPPEQNDKQVQKYYLGHNFIAAGNNLILINVSNIGRNIRSVTSAKNSNDDKSKQWLDDSLHTSWVCSVSPPGMTD